MKIKPYKPGMKLEGLISGMPNDVYHNVPDSISKSGLDLINRSPAHYFYAQKKEPTRAMQLGTALHTAILEPDVFSRHYVLLSEVSDRRSSIYKEAVKTHGADNVLTGPEADSVAGMQESVYANDKARRLIQGCEHKEISVFATCPATGLNIRCRFDGLSIEGNYAIDLKTTRDARPDEFSKSIFNYRYHVQDAFYRYVFLCATGVDLDRFEFIAVENEIPHVTMMYQLDDISRAIGESGFKSDLSVVKECLTAGIWPGYDNENEIISIPEWAIMRHEAETDSDVVVL